MVNFIRYSLRLLPLLAAVLLLCSGTVAKAQEPLRSLSLQLFYWHESNSAFMLTEENLNEKRERRFLEPIRLWYMAGEAVEAVQVRPGQRSGLITVRAGADIVFYRIDPTGLESIPESDILRVPAPAQVGQGLLLLSYTNSDLTANLIDVSDSRIPRGSLRVVNYSGRQVATKIGESVVPLAAGASQVVRLPRDDSRLNLMMAELDKENEWKLFYSTVVSIDPNERMLVMVYLAGQKRETLRVKILNIPN